MACHRTGVPRRKSTSILWFDIKFDSKINCCDEIISTCCDQLNNCMLRYQRSEYFRWSRKYWRLPISYAVKEAILQYSKRGFSSFILGLKSSKSTDYSSAFIVSNYATSWREKYEENNFHSVDPTVGHALGSLRPLTWSRSTFRSVAECEFYEEASHFGIKTGITFPIHGVSGEFGLISFASDQDLAPRDLLVAAEPLAWLRDIVFDITLRLMSESAQTLKKSPLTPRESECLKWIVMGKTSWEISKILFCWSKC